MTIIPSVSKLNLLGLVLRFGNRGTILVPWATLAGHGREGHVGVWKQKKYYVLCKHLAIQPATLSGNEGYHFVSWWRSKVTVCFNFSIEDGWRLNQRFRIEDIAKQHVPETELW